MSVDRLFRRLRSCEESNSLQLAMYIARTVMDQTRFALSLKYLLSYNMAVSKQDVNNFGSFMKKYKNSSLGNKLINRALQGLILSLHQR